MGESGMGARTPATTGAAAGGAADSRLLVGAIAAPHGVRGLVKVKSFTAAPADIAAYGPLSDETGRRRIALHVMSPASGGTGALICRIDGVADRDAAEALKGLRLYVERAALPAPAEAEEYYHADLIGLAATLPDGTAFGRVVAVQNYGAGDLIEVERLAGAPRLVDLPFTRAVVPVVDIAGGRLVVDPPAELLEPAGAGPEAGDARKEA
jgi:16S rRNA processing protein RimM